MSHYSCGLHEGRKIDVLYLSAYCFHPFTEYRLVVPFLLKSITHMIGLLKDRTTGSGGQFYLTYIQTITCSVGRQRRRAIPQSHWRQTLFSQSHLRQTLSIVAQSPQPVGGMLHPVVYKSNYIHLTAVISYWLSDIRLHQINYLDVSACNNMMGYSKARPSSKMRTMNRGNLRLPILLTCNLLRSCFHLTYI